MLITVLIIRPIILIEYFLLYKPSAEVEWIPSTTVHVNDAQAEDVSKLIERLEQDEDVQKVFHNMG